MSTEKTQSEAESQPSCLGAVISRLLLLKRYNACTCAGNAESGDVWTELDEDINGELIKFEDIEKLIADIKNGL